MIEIIICEKNTKWVDSFIEKMDVNMHVADTVVNGKDCQRALTEKKIDVIIINIDTKNFSFFEVVKFIKQRYPRIHIIMTVDEKVKLDEYFFSERDVVKLGISSTFKRPFPLVSMVSYISKAFAHRNWQDAKPSDSAEGKDDTLGKEVKHYDREFTSLAMENFPANNIIIFDLYIRIAKDKYLKVFNKGERIDLLRIEKYLKKDPNLRLYFILNQRLSYINYVNELIEKQLKKSGESNIQIVKKIESSSKLFIEEVYSAGLPEHTINQAQLLCSNIYDTIHKNSNLKNLLKDYIQDEKTAETHIFLVAFYTAIISENVDWITSHSRSGLIFGAILHDIGKVKFSTKLRNKSKEEYTEQDWVQYRKHPEFGVEILDKISGISEQVKQIVYQHHELNTGEGFPNKLTSTKIYPLAKIVGFANFLSNKSIEHSLSPLATIKRAIEDRDEIMNYEPFVIKAFIKGFVENV